MVIVVRNWRNVHPTIAHKSGLDWRLLGMPAKTSGDIEVEVDPKFQCLKTITYVSLAKLQPTLSYEPHDHQDHEEVYYIISGSGQIKVGGESARFRDGDVIYIPEKAVHSITNDGSEMIEFLAFGGLTGGG
ncbi:putative cupin 2, conserved barrel domain protein [Candidatus Nitrososphaera gargensis Ga9.2]|uniref:Putative cupin 2, conserved barrel domain protein n=1 Tax=Nitrososphaera gargensis (strain Ga9.2) TaxID=1237085 RepID=K0I8H3_NITGG|nr:cupin domain-containing protein [Candidatus Nitrososphaera gargensis]AFU57576.1 putative cupin 2, conserved barrel domain protein [Candidatus Nitrososphaera gargensis Ga9.2]